MSDLDFEKGIGSLNKRTYAARVNHNLRSLPSLAPRLTRGQRPQPTQTSRWPLVASVLALAAFSRNATRPKRLNHLQYSAVRRGATSPPGFPPATCSPARARQARRPEAPCGPSPPPAATAALSARPCATPRRAARRPCRDRVHRPRLEQHCDEAICHDFDFGGWCR